MDISVENLRQAAADAMAGVAASWKFGQMLNFTNEALKNQVPPGVCPRQTPVNNSREAQLLAGGWNRGSGLKGWLAHQLPEVSYVFAYRCLKLYQNVVSALGRVPSVDEAKAFITSEGGAKKVERMKREAVEPAMASSISAEQVWAEIQADVHTFTAWVSRREDVTKLSRIQRETLRKSIKELLRALNF